MLTEDTLIARYSGSGLRDGTVAGQRFASAAFSFRDPSPVKGTDAEITAVAVGPVGGRLLIGGTFSPVHGSARANLARLNTDGSLDTNFQPELDRGVRAIVVQPNGQVLIGGNVNTIAGHSRFNMARLNPDGSLDGSFDPGTGTDDLVHALALPPDNKVLVGGSFYNYNSLSRRGIARVHAPTEALSVCDPIPLPTGRTTLQLAQATPSRLSRPVLMVAANPGSGGGGEEPFALFDGWSAISGVVFPLSFLADFC